MKVEQAYFYYPYLLADSNSGLQPTFSSRYFLQDQKESTAGKALNVHAADLDSISEPNRVSQTLPAVIPEHKAIYWRWDYVNGKHCWVWPPKQIKIIFLFCHAQNFFLKLNSKILSTRKAGHHWGPGIDPVLKDWSDSCPTQHCYEDRKSLATWKSYQHAIS